MNELNYDITPISLEYFKQRSFEIIFNVFNSMNSSEDELITQLSHIVNHKFLYKKASLNPINRHFLI
ncbi:hypothetical protein [Aliarcobacter butzleri]|uniref:hypothetical protein n=1 Tax=Aliarcobacter butzleri TaxID=28197 RepID=UPI0021B60A15|nr:hypothetical protein [Aliarcobacter butzleri]MCT7570419.1 hypothetical protein [Aliarcobacter butzleri]